jgi:hypothetical protein
VETGEIDGDGNKSIPVIELQAVNYELILPKEVSFSIKLFFPLL